MVSETGEPAVLFEVADRIARITLNRPQKYNSMDMRFARDFHSAVASIAADDEIAAVVLAANGPAFCAGGDLDAMFEATDLQAYFTEQAELLHAAIGRLSTLPVVVVVAASGAVAGGGLGLVLAGDLVVIGDDTTFTPAYPRLGFTPDCGVTAQLPKTVGVRRALEYSVGGRRLSASDALDWGIATEVVPVHSVLTRALELATAVVGGAPRALGFTRALMRSSSDRDLQESLDLEARTIVAQSMGQESIDLRARFRAARGGR